MFLFIYIYICVVICLYIYIYMPWRSVGRSNFDWGLRKFNNVDSNNDRQIKRNTMLYIYIFTASTPPRKDTEVFEIIGVFTFVF